MDACETQRNNWDELEVTREELQSLTDCLKKEEFRKLLIEYAKEVTSPESRKIYQDELTQLERERGVDVTFVNPQPGYVIKTSVNGEKKCFINISKSSCIEKPTSQPSYGQGHRGLQWTIPYTLSPPRDDLDDEKLRCCVFDVVFHPDTLYLASKNPQFREIVNNTALDGVESNFKVRLDRNNLTFPKIDYKGTCESTVIRKKCEKPPLKSLDIEPEIYQKLMSAYDAAREKSQKSETKPARPVPPTTILNPKKPAITETPNYTTPKFLIKHQTDLDIQDFRNSKDARMHAATAKNLVVVVDLPLLKSASDAELDVQERLLTVSSEKPAKYRLMLPLPCRVDAEGGSARFDTTKRKLTVTLPVVRAVCDDSGVESDHGSPPLPPMIPEEPKIVEKPNDYESETSSTDSASEVRACEAYRTISPSTLSFLDPEIKYSLPHFSCVGFDNRLALTVDVKNVDASSIRYKILDANAGIHITLSSVGAGFFPVYYALCLKIQDGAVSSEDIVVEPWDNNVVFTVQVSGIGSISRYFVGLDSEFMELRELPHIGSEKIGRSREDLEGEAEDVGESVLDSDDEVAESGELEECLENRNSSLASESSGDELPSGSSSKCRGILKKRRSLGFSRSVSESSIDEAAGLLSSVDLNYDSVHDLNSESDCCSLKKTVRFSDVVSRQLFRSNSSILGRRKKNQRKLRKKKQAFERRMSESENSETEERDKYKLNVKNNTSHEGQSIDNIVKPIIFNRDNKLVSQQKMEKHETEKIDVNGEKPEFKNDLIFDLDF